MKKPSMKKIFQDQINYIFEEVLKMFSESGFIGKYLDSSNIRGTLPGTTIPWGAAGYPEDVAATEADGADATVARAGHRHAMGILTTLGDILFRAATVADRLAGNTTTTRKFLRQVGTGAASADPAWDTIADDDVPATHSGSAHHAQAHDLFDSVSHEDVYTVVAPSDGDILVWSAALSKWRSMAFAALTFGAFWFDDADQSGEMVPAGIV